MITKIPKHRVVVATAETSSNLQFAFCLVNFLVARHSIPYGQLPKYFVAFDLYDTLTEKFVCLDANCMYCYRGREYQLRPFWNDAPLVRTRITPPCFEPMKAWLRGLYSVSTDFVASCQDGHGVSQIRHGGRKQLVARSSLGRCRTLRLLY